MLGGGADTHINVGTGQGQVGELIHLDGFRQGLVFQSGERAVSPGRADPGFTLGEQVQSTLVLHSVLYVAAGAVDVGVDHFEPFETGIIHILILRVAGILEGIRVVDQTIDGSGNEGFACAAGGGAVVDEFAGVGFHPFNEFIPGLRGFRNLGGIIVEDDGGAAIGDEFFRIDTRDHLDVREVRHLVEIEIDEQIFRISDTFLFSFLEVDQVVSAVFSDDVEVGGVAGLVGSDIAGADVGVTGTGEDHHQFHIGGAVFLGVVSVYNFSEDILNILGTGGPEFDGRKIVSEDGRANGQNSHDCQH